MIGNLTLSQELESFIGSESKEFAVQAGRLKTFKSTIGLFAFGGLWTTFTLFIAYFFVGPLLQGKEVNFESNGVPTVASPDNLAPIIPVAIFLGFFLLIGIGILGYGIYVLKAPGHKFVGTPSRLIIKSRSKIRSIDWEQFNGDIQLSDKGETGDIVMRLRTGKMVSQKNSSPRYVPDVISLPAIPFPREIEQICRKRIKENDPTPPDGQATQDLPGSLV